MIIITGGAGFIGSHIVKQLESNNHSDIVICDVLGNGDKWKNIAKREVAYVISPGELFEFINDQEKDIETIFHMGAISSTTETNADLIIRSNFNLTMELWNWCSKHNAALIYASSAATYGIGSFGFSDDNTSESLGRLVPLNPYAWSKHAVDRRIARIVSNNGPRPSQWAGLKFFNVYGPNEYHKAGQLSVVFKSYKEITETGKALLFCSHNPKYKDGEQMRDFVWVGDCVDIALWLQKNPKISGIFNVGTGKARTFKDLVLSVFSAIKREPSIEYIDMPSAIQAQYQYFTEAEMSRLVSAGYKTEPTSLEEGVKKYVGEFLSTDDPYI